MAAFPLFLLPARGAFEAIDPALEDVARLLGRSELSVFLAVTLPLAWRGLAAGIVLAFARSLGDFGATLMVAGNIPGLTQTAALAIYDAVQVNDAARAGWLTLWISAVSIVALLVVQRTLAGARHRAVSDPLPRDPGRPAGPPGPSRPDARRRAPARPRDRRRVRAVRGGQDDPAAADRRADARPIRATSASTATTLFDAARRIEPTAATTAGSA